MPRDRKCRGAQNRLQGSHSEGTEGSGTNQPTVHSRKEVATRALGALLTFVTLAFTRRGHRGPDLAGSPLDLLFDLFHQQRLTAAEPPGAWCGPGAPFAGLHGPVELQRAAQEGAHAFGPHVQDGVRVAHLFQVPAEDRTSMAQASPGFFLSDGG